MKTYTVYIITNEANRVLYIGITNDLQRRLYEHKEKIFGGFSEKYNLHKLIYFEIFENVDEAIRREKQLKGWLRQKKVDLIQVQNPEWRDLALECVI